MNTKTTIKNFLTNNPGKIVSVAILTLCSVACKIMGPIFIKLIMDFSLKGESFQDNSTTVIILTVCMGVATVLSFVFDSLRQTKSVRLGNELTANLRSNVYQVMMKSELYEINKIDTDDLCGTIVDSTHIIGDEYVSNRVIKLSYNALYLLSLMITMFVFNQMVGFVALLTLPLLYVINKYLGKLKDKRTTVYLKSKDNHEKIIKDRFEQLKTIKTRNGISKEANSYESVLKDNKKNYAKEVYTNECNNDLVPNIFIGITWFAIVLAAVIDLASTHAADHSLFITKIGSIVGCIAISPRIITTFKTMLDIHSISLDVDKEYQKLDRIFNMKAESRSENVPSLEEIHDIKFNNVSFDYENYGITDKVNLDKIDFEVKKGERLGIIGLPGSGKTTIADLITKVIRPRQGNVLINNCDINKLNTYYLRDIVTYVPQNYELLDASIEENIIYPLSLDEYKYNDSLNKCKLKDLIFSLADHDETNARKANLSAADIQKISLANAFYKDSPIVILDDATSKLDTVTEEEIMSEFFKLKNKISIVISNRINNIAECDKVLIINNGKVSEYGKVEDLLANKNSAFSRMVTDARLHKRVV